MPTKAPAEDIEVTLYFQLKALTRFARAGCVCSTLTEDEQKRFRGVLNEVLKKMPS